MVNVFYLKFLQDLLAQLNGLGHKAEGLISQKNEKKNIVYMKTT